MGKPCVYISGPMSGIEDWNFPAFNAAADKLRAAGYPVINPADFGVKEGQTWRECLARDLAALVHCDVLVLLPGWIKSKGACLEVHVAEELGMETTTLHMMLVRAEVEALKLQGSV